MKVREISAILRKKFGDAYQESISSEDEEIKTLLTDSRNIFLPETTLFFAINTPGGGSGHDYIKELAGKGVRNFVVEKVPDGLDQEGLNLFIVSDTIEALTTIGSQHRERAEEVVAIAGSRGKTTVKEMIFQLMEPYKNISRSPRSYNSKIGVPLSLWQIPEDTELALIEAGISKKDEMHRLADAIQPDTVIFTNIGEAHSQGFDSMQEKTLEKLKIAEGERVKTIIYPLDSKLISEEIQNLEGKDIHFITWSQKDTKADLYITPKAKHDSNENEIEYVWEGKKHSFAITLEKDYDIENIAGSLTFMLKEGLSPKEIEQRFKKFHRINTRLNVSEGINGCSLIMDSYTSDSSSLLPAIDFMRRRKMPGKEMTLIISDLYHEGEDPGATYSEMAKIIKDAGITRMIGIGKSLKKFSGLFPKDSLFYDNTESLLKQISASDFNDEIILVKGAPEFGLERIYRQLEARNHETVLEVNLDAMLRNYNYFRSHVPSSTGMIAMVKASGYGAGSYEIAKTLQDAGAAYLAVAVLDEGIDLRKSGITMPIMIMNPRSANYKSLFSNKLEPVVYSFPILESLINEAGRNKIEEYPVHIKLDTGMHRMGFEEKDLELLINLLKNNKNVKVSTIFSHLATADCVDMDEYTLLQLQRFEKMSSRLISDLGYPVKRHILNSAGIIRFPEYHYDYVRLGIGLYGANTLPPEIERPLSCVSSLRTVIICLREIEGEEAVGYGRRGKISGKTRIATLPLGYADGINRKFGNGRLKVAVNGHLVPTIGNICMDAMMIDVTGIECKEGDSVEIFGDKVNISVLADTLETIPYEILTSVSPRVKRIYYRE